MGKSTPALLQEYSWQVWKLATGQPRKGFLTVGTQSLKNSHIVWPYILFGIHVKKIIKLVSPDLTQLYLLKHDTNENTVMGEP